MNLPSSTHESADTESSQPSRRIAVTPDLVACRVLAILRARVAEHIQPVRMDTW